jgi:hypothetical protein
LAGDLSTFDSCAVCKETDEAGAERLVQGTRTASSTDLAVEKALYSSVSALWNEAHKTPSMAHHGAVEYADVIVSWRMVARLTAEVLAQELEAHRRCVNVYVCESCCVGKEGVGVFVCV